MTRSECSPVLWIRKALEKFEGGGPLVKAARATVHQLPEMDGLEPCVLEWAQNPQVVAEIMRSLQGSTEANLDLLTDLLLAQDSCRAVQTAGDARTVVVTFLDTLRFTILDAQVMVLGQP